MSFDADGRRRRAEHVVMATLTASTRPLIFVVSFAALMVAHQLGDHVLQTDRQALGKTGRGPTAVLAMLGHLLSYHVAGAVLVAATFAALDLPLRLAGVAAGLGFSALTHAALDRRRLVRAILHRTGAPRFAEATTPVNGMYAADQALHQAALLVSALLIAVV